MSTSNRKGFELSLKEVSGSNHWNVSGLRRDLVNNFKSKNDQERHETSEKTRGIRFLHRSVTPEIWRWSQSKWLKRIVLVVDLLCLTHTEPPRGRDFPLQRWSSCSSLAPTPAASQNALLTKLQLTEGHGSPLTVLWGLSSSVWLAGSCRDSQSHCQHSHTAKHCAHQHRTLHTF